MEKINLVEILKDCPKGMELDCTVFNSVTFGGIDSSSSYPIKIKIGDNYCYKWLTEFGEWSTDENSKCVIFPKGKTTWEGFVPLYKFKEGDVIFKRNFITIIHLIEEEGKIWYHCWFNTKYENYKLKKGYGIGNINDGDEVRLATEEEKAKLFKVIKENGYTWNAEEKTLEELIKPIFKKGDKVRVKNGLSEYRVIDNVEDTFYSLVPIGRIDFTDQNRWELVPNKFDINTLVPFESRVLVRDYTNSAWLPALWGIYKDNDDSSYPYKLVGTMSRYCIPYEGNEHLIGKTDDCNDFYKTWK